MGDSARIRALVALGLAGAALLGAILGFSGTWDTFRGSVGQSSQFSGSVTVDYHLYDARTSAFGRDARSSYAAQNAPPEFQQTFRELQAFVIAGTVLAGAAVAGLGLSAWGLLPPVFRNVSVALLAAFAVTSLLGSTLFAYNFVHTFPDSGNSSGDSPSKSFWGSQDGFSWGPAFAWYASLASVLLALAAIVVAVLPEATPAGKPSAATPGVTGP